MTTDQIQMLVQHASEEMKKRGVDSKSGEMTEREVGSKSGDLTQSETRPEQEDHECSQEDHKDGDVMEEERITRIFEKHPGLREFFNLRDDRKNTVRCRRVVCHRCMETGEEKWFFSLMKCLRMHYSVKESHKDDVDKNLYYRCTALECRSIFLMYEEQLEHRLSHSELFCTFCGKFQYSHWHYKAHAKECPQGPDQQGKYVTNKESRKKMNPKQKPAGSSGNESIYWITFSSNILDNYVTDNET